MEERWCGALAGYIDGNCQIDFVILWGIVYIECIENCVFLPSHSSGRRLLQIRLCLPRKVVSASEELYA